MYYVSEGCVSCFQGCMNSVTFGDDKFGYYETVAGGAGAVSVLVRVHHAPWVVKVNGFSVSILCFFFMLKNVTGNLFKKLNSIYIIFRMSEDAKSTYNRASDVCMYVCMYHIHVLDRKLLERLMSPSPKSQVMLTSAFS